LSRMGLWTVEVTWEDGTTVVAFSCLACAKAAGALILLYRRGAACSIAFSWGSSAGLGRPVTPR
jgi:hypothetical protein